MYVCDIDVIGLDTAVSVEMLHGIPEVSSLYRRKHVLARHGGKPLRVKARVDDVSTVPHVLLEEVSDGTILDRPDPFLGRKGDHLLVEHGRVDHQAPVVGPLGKEAGEVSVPNGPEPFLWEDRGHASRADGDGVRKGIEGREHGRVDGNVRDDGNPVHNGADNVYAQCKVGSIHGDLDGIEPAALELDLDPEVRDNLRDGIDVLAEGRTSRSDRDVQAVDLRHENVVEVGLGFFEAAAFRAGAGGGAAHQEQVMGLVVFHPGGGDIESGACRCDNGRASAGGCGRKGRGGHQEEGRKGDDSLELLERHGCGVACIYTWKELEYWRI